MRRGEVLGLRWSDVDVDTGRLAVRHTLSAPRNPDTGQHLPVFGEPKTRRGKRSVPLPGQTVAALRAHRKAQAAERLLAGLPRIRFHDLRHTYATLAPAAGVHPKVVSGILGHATIGITLDTYSHAIPSLQESAAETVAALVFGGS